MNTSTKTLPPWVAGLPGDKNHRPLSAPVAEHAAEQTTTCSPNDQLPGKIKALGDMIWQELN